MRRSLPFLLVGAVLWLGIAGPGCKDDRGGNPNEIVIGEYASLTGATATFGTSSHDGAVLAIDEVNKAGGLLGKQIKLITADDRSDAQEANTAVQKLISRDKVVAILGEVASKRSLAGATVCQKFQVPMLSPASTNPTVTQVGDYIFRICFIDDFQGKVGAEFAHKKGWKKVALFTDVANDYSKGLAKAFRESYPGPNGQIVIEESYREGDNDFKAQLSKIKSAGADAVYLPGYYTDVGKVLRQAREIGLNVPVFGGDGWDSPETLKLGSVANNCFYTDHYSPDDDRPEAQKFQKAFQARYGRTPDAMAVLGYDAARVLMDAIKRAGKAEPKAIRDALAQTKDFPGATGTITIDANRNALKPIVILELKDGRVHKVDAIEPK